MELKRHYTQLYPEKTQGRKMMMARGKLLIVSILAIALLNIFSSRVYSTDDNEPIPHNGEKKMSSIEETVLFDFDTDDSIAGWSSVNDTVMGGISSGRLEKSENGTAVFTGNVSLENNGGFASVQGPTILSPLAEFEGIAIRVKSDGKKYKCTLRTDKLFDGISHQANFETKNDEWQIVKIPFSAFVPTYHGRKLAEDKRMDRGLIKKMGFLISDKQMGPFRLQIDWIKAFR